MSKEKIFEVRICPNTFYAENIKDWRDSAQIENDDAFPYKQNEIYSAKKSGKKFLIISKTK